VKVTLNPKHFHLRTNAEDGTIWLTREKYLHPLIRVKDVTHDVLLCLCADLSAGGETQVVERSVKFNDGFVCKITVEVVQDVPE
jgi:hypothetical protein